MDTATRLRPAAPSRVAALTLLCALGAVPAWLLAGAVTSPFTWAERDWNNDGRTTPGEYVHAVDIGARAVECADGSLGTEYFRLKDGLPEKTDCARAWLGDPRDVRL